jgi:mRNA-degrading endonuclease toxin of MazEF toxin-antitoxin module
VSFDRGGIYRFRLNPIEGSEQAGEARPCLVVQRQSLAKARTVIVVPLTTKPQRAHAPLNVYLAEGTAGLKREQWVKITQIRAVSTTRVVGGKMAQLNEKEFQPIRQALGMILDL